MSPPRRPRKAALIKDSVTSPEVPPAEPVGPLEIPATGATATLEIGPYQIKLTSLDKPIWPAPGPTKRDLLRYYLAVAPALVPHLRERPMVMKRWPRGLAGKPFFNKRCPASRPGCVRTCTIDHGNGNIIDFPMVCCTGSLLWMVNLGCIDLNPWHGRTVDVNKPDVLWMDLDPGDAPFSAVCEAALILRERLDARGLPSHVRTSGSQGLHVAVPLEHGPYQKAVWTEAKTIAEALEASHPSLVTARYKTADRPAGRVLADYNQNRWGATLASVYSVRPTPAATVSTPLTWDELAAGVRLEDFTIETVPARIAAAGDLWAPLLPTAAPRWALPAADNS